MFMLWEGALLHLIEFGMEFYDFSFLSVKESSRISV